MITLKESEFIGFINFHNESRKNEEIDLKADAFEKKLSYNLKVVVPMRYIIFELLKDLQFNIKFEHRNSIPGYEILVLKNLEKIKPYTTSFLSKKKKYDREYYSAHYQTIGRIEIRDNELIVNVVDNKYNKSLMKLSRLLTEYGNVTHTFSHDFRTEIITFLDIEKDSYKEYDYIFKSENLKKIEAKTFEKESYRGSDYGYC